MQSVGIRGHIHDWFKNYLSNRTQFVYYNSTISEVKGIPQGSIIGPILFIIYLNYFSRASDILFSILFADDTTVLIEGHSYNNIITILNNELYKIDTWLETNKLTININKTHYMVFHRARLKPTKDVMIRQNKKHQISWNNIDDKIKWTEHINYVKIKFLNRQVYFSKSEIILIKIH